MFAAACSKGDGSSKSDVTKASTAQGTNAKGPGAKGLGAKGLGAKGLGAKGPGAKGPGAAGDKGTSLGNAPTGDFALAPMDELLPLSGSVGSGSARWARAVRGN